MPTPVHGAGLSQQVTSGYGVANPGPAGATGMFASAAVGEALGTAADISNTAQYTPVTHAVEFTGPAPKEPLYEGDLVAIHYADKKLTLHHTPENFDAGAGFVRPLAADLMLLPGTGRRRNKGAFHATIAWSAAAKVKIAKGSTLADAPRAAGDAVYVYADNNMFKLACKPAANSRLLGRLLLATQKHDSHASVCLDV